MDITLDVIRIWSYLAVTRYRRAAARFREEGGRIDLMIRSWQVEPGAVSGQSKLEQSGVTRVNALAINRLRWRLPVAMTAGSGAWLRQR